MKTHILILWILFSLMMLACQTYNNSSQLSVSATSTTVSQDPTDPSQVDTVYKCGTKDLIIKLKDGSVFASVQDDDGNVNEMIQLEPGDYNLGRKCKFTVTQEFEIILQKDH